MKTNLKKMDSFINVYVKPTVLNFINTENVTEFDNFIQSMKEDLHFVIDCCCPPYKQDTVAYKEFVFEILIYVCHKQQLLFVKIIYEQLFLRELQRIYFCLYNSVKDESYYTYLLFMCCEKGLLDIFQWLIQKEKIDIHQLFQNKHCLFIKACENGHLSIVQYIQTIKPFWYKIKDKKYLCKYNNCIRTDNEYLQKMYVLWLSNHLISPNPQCIFYQLPHEVSRYIAYFL
jgi:hypothetical protein